MTVPSATSRTLNRSERRRCRAELPYANWTGFTGVQCSFIAITTRELRPENRELPVCGVHARAKSAREYRAYTVHGAPVEAVAR